MKFSPGQKAFFSDAYVKALVRQQERNAVMLLSSWMSRMALSSPELLGRDAGDTDDSRPW